MTPSIGHDGKPSRSFALSDQLLTKRLWIGLLLAAVVLGLAGFWVRQTVEGVMQAQLADDLQSLLGADVEALHLLFGSHQAVATIIAGDSRVRRLVGDLLARGDLEPADLLRTPELGALRAELGPWLGKYEYDGFRILNRQGRVIAAFRDVTLGAISGPEEQECLSAVFKGQAGISRPRPSEVPIPDRDGVQHLGVPTMFVLAPILADDGEAIAALGFRLRPDRTFTRVLNVAQRGRSGETFAFSREGLLLSESRFDDELKRIGLIADQPYSRSGLSLELRDPGIDMTSGNRPALLRRDQPLTRMVVEAAEGKPGVDITGFRDYRGVPSVCAWTWLPEYGFGVATKLDKAEAYQPLMVLRTAFWGLFGLLATTAVALFAFTVSIARLQRRVRQATLAARRLERYTLEDKLGEGGMGIVYRAHHAMLRRPTAVKLLHPDRADDVSIARFEREVQLTSQLNHPNTITIYDYGRTPEGVFYYAMEYLDGVDLQTLVDRHGPQPEGRVIHLLAQVCASLDEAHGVGLIHRDIKPANIILTRRGKLRDFIKVLDFGLARAVDEKRAAALTCTGTVVGTPLYLAPESLRGSDGIDARSDIYAVGAVGYFLLTGQPPFEEDSIMELLLKVTSGAPVPPSVRLGRPVSSDLEAVLLHCLAKEPDARPPSAQSLADEFARCTAAGTWSTSEAEEWWRVHALNAPDPVTTPGSGFSPTVALSTAVGQETSESTRN